MKRGLLFVLISIILITTLVLVACDSLKLFPNKEDTDNENLKFVAINGSEAKVTQCLDAELTTVEIPSIVKINGKSYTVTTIDKEAFRNCSSLTTITIPNSVTTIKEQAFYDCSSLTTVTIPHSVTQIESWAFAHCSSLASIIIPDSVVTIGDYVFNDCTNLTIYCELTSKPDGWHPNWNYSNRPVVWKQSVVDCIDTNNDHKCDDCNDKLSDCLDQDLNGFCDICKQKIDIVIKFYHTMGENLNTVLDEHTVEFNKLYPNIHVKWEQVGNYDDVKDQISTELTIGQSPNLAYCYPDHVALYNISGSARALNDFIDNQTVITRSDGSTEIIGLTEEQKSNFIEGFFDNGNIFEDGLTYTMPISKSTEVLYYNKTFFDQHGLSVPTNWDEMESVCRRIKQIDPDSIPLGYDSEANWFINMCEQLGSPYTSPTGDHFLFNNQTNRDFVKRFRGWYLDGLVTTQELYGSYTSGLFTTIGQSTAEKKIIKSYMCIGSSAGATHQRPSKVDGAYPFEVGIAPIPQVNAENPKVISQGPSVCIFKKNNPQEVIASWLFVKYLTTSVDFQAAFSLASGYVPVLKSVADHPIYKAEVEKANGYDHIAMLSAQVCLTLENAYYVSPAFNGSSVARDEVGKLMVGVFSADKNADVDAIIQKAFDDAIQECRFRAGL